MRLFLIAVVSAYFFAVGSIRADETENGTKSDKGTTLGREQVQHLQIGIRITATGPMRGVFTTIPIPMDWPEQTVRVTDEDISPNVGRVDYRVLDESVKQMVVTIPRLDAGEKAHAIITVEIKANETLAPKDTAIFEIPKKASGQIRKYLAASPMIESRNRVIQNTAKQLAKDKPTEAAWATVENVYDFVREKIKYKESKLKGAVQSLRDGEGDCEAMTSLFIAMCRANNVPARMVWVTDHCYPEFYLNDDEGTGHWFPCQVAGSRAFGAMPDIRPIFQKGDNIKIPEKKKGERYASLFLKAKSIRGGSPRIEEVVEFITKQ